MLNKMLQISSLGSADKQNQLLGADWLKAFEGTDVKPLIGTVTKEQVENSPIFNVLKDWDESPNNPIIQGFQNLFSNSATQLKFDDPNVQTGLFDIDNMVKGKIGVFRENQQGLIQFGSDIDGKPLYTYNDIKDDQSFDLGKNRLFTIGSAAQLFGAFADEEEADRFAKFTEQAGNPELMGRITGLSSAGDKKGAVNEVLRALDFPDIDGLENYDDKDRAYGAAFAAYNFVENAGKLSPAQQSLALSTLGAYSFKFKDGSNLQTKALIKNPDGTTALSLGDAMVLGSQGIDTYSLQKNWDQLDVMQRLTFGKGTANQMAATGQRMGLLGPMTMGGVSVMQTPEELGSAGFTAVPSAGIGAITGNKDALPEGYEVVGAGQNPGQVIAVPKGLSGFTSTLNGTPEIRSLNSAPGVKPASMGAFKLHANWLGAPRQVDTTRGTSFASGIGQSGMLNDPYLKSALVASSVFGNTISKSQIEEKVGEQLIQSVTETAANAATGGVYKKVKQGVDLLTGGKGSDVIDKAFEVNNKVNPLAPTINKLVGSAVLGVMGAFGGKSEEQQARDKVRELGVKSGLFDGNSWTVTLSDGTTADIGKDGKSEKHSFRFADKVVGKAQDLHVYDVDYTNDLDFSSNMMTSALVRMMSGGKGVPIDQIAGQLANAALGRVGFGQDMTEDNFNYVRDNVRGFFFKQGVQTKEDAYALANQMFAEGRITETDTIAMHQGINMVFDDNGFDTAQILMAGRWKGLEVAAEIPNAPGPNFKPRPITKPADVTDVDVEGSLVFAGEYGLDLDYGTYGGNNNTDAFTKSIVKYKEQNAAGRRR